MISLSLRTGRGIKCVLTVAMGMEATTELYGKVLCWWAAIPDGREIATNRKGTDQNICPYGVNQHKPTG